jgi:uncharacterized protein (DUF2062 family)
MPVRYLVVQYRYYLARLRRFIAHDVLHADDPPHPLALGAAIGIFIMYTPTFGFQMLLIVFVAWLLKANKVIGIPVAWVSNPATAVPIYYACFVVGRVLLGHPHMEEGWWAQLAKPPVGLWARVEFYWSKVMEIAAPLWVGSIVLGVITAIPTYYAVYYAVGSYRMRRWGQLTPPPVVMKKRRKRADFESDEAVQRSFDD